MLSKKEISIISNIAKKITDPSKFAKLLNAVRDV